jgi:GxxExxY protein
LEESHRDTMTQSNTEKKFKPLSAYEQWLATQVVGMSIKIHSQLGPGLLEKIYEECFCRELLRRKIAFQRQRTVPLYYEGELITQDGLRLDLVIDDLLIIELKAQENFHPVWEAQLLSYMKLSSIRLGYLFNFNVPLMKNGIKRKIL